MPSPRKRKAMPRQAADLAMRQRFTDLNSLAMSVPLGSHTAEMLYFGLLGERWWRNYLHAHSFYEVCYAFAGRGSFRIDGQAHDIAPGDLFIAKPGQPHEIISSREAPLAIYFWAHTLTRQPSRQPGNSQGSGTTANSARRGNDIDALLDRFALSTPAVASGMTGVGRVCGLLTDEIARRQAGCATACEALLVKLILDTARSVTPASGSIEVTEPRAHSAAEAMVQRVRAYLRDNFARPITVRDIAAQVHLSERHVARLFRAVTGVSPLEYLTAVRLEHASRLLLDANRTIKEIARACGYPDVRYFTTLFGRRTGLTPAAFRAERGTRFLDGRRHEQQA